MNQANKHGFIFGLLCPGDWRAKKEATMYSYNGVVLPKLPEWDKETYPYAVILEYSATNRRLFVFTTKPVFDGEYLRLSLPWRYFVYYMVDETAEQFDPLGGYTSNNSSGDEIFVNPAIWSNFDILNTNGTVYLSASDPEPVYE